MLVIPGRERYYGGRVPFPAFQSGNRCRTQLTIRGDGAPGLVIVPNARDASEN
jgi:hypothetical protein